MDDRPASVGGPAPAPATAFIGISIEPLEAVQGQVAAHQVQQLQSALSTPAALQVARVASAETETMNVARRLLKHFYNYVTSFLADGTDQTALRIMQNWHAAVERKLRLDPGFLKRDEE